MTRPKNERMTNVSHKITVKTEFNDKDALGAAAKKIGGRVIGEGTHHLYNGQTAKGFAVQLASPWIYPIVLTPAGTLEFDNFNNNWGNSADLETLKAEYLIEVAVKAAENLGWMTQRTPEGTIDIFHPDGGVLTVTRDGVVDANGFHGIGCKGAVETIAAALGQTQTATDKAEMAIAFVGAQQVVA